MRRADRIGQNRTALDKNRQIIMRTQEICGICGQPVDFSYKNPHPLSPTVDHIVPIAKGGHPSDLANLQLAHRWCNRWKSDRTIGTTMKIDERETEVDNHNLPQHFDWSNYRPI